MDCVTPDWPPSIPVNCFTTTRVAGHSQGAYSSFNLADHVGDDAATVSLNRIQLLKRFNLPQRPLWPKQVHGTNIVDAAALASDNTTTADGVYTHDKNVVCAILTADCLPIALVERQGKEIAVVHAGWRGLLAGIVHRALEKFQSQSADLFAWIGPGISARAYIVNESFRHQFVDRNPDWANAFTYREDVWFADLAHIAESELQAGGVKHITRYSGCTSEESTHFYSYRRDGETGRMATVAWLDSTP